MSRAMQHPDGSESEVRRPRRGPTGDVEGGTALERFIRLTLLALVVVLAVTGAFVGTAGAVTDDDATTDQVAIKRDQDDLDGLLARSDDDDDDSADASRSADRSADVTTPDRSRSLDRSRDKTGDRVGALDRSNSLDRSLDRTGDHNTADVSNSRDVSGDQTTDGGVTDTNTDD
jgi:hypothetical protein